MLPVNPEDTIHQPPHRALVDIVRRPADDRFAGLQWRFVRIPFIGDAVSYTQSPAPGSPTTEGKVTVFIDGTDVAGNVGHTYFYVSVMAAAPARTVLAGKGDIGKQAGEACENRSEF